MVVAVGSSFLFSSGSAGFCLSLSFSFFFSFFASVQSLVLVFTDPSLSFRVVCRGVIFNYFLYLPAYLSAAIYLTKLTHTYHISPPLVAYTYNIHTYTHLIQQ